jgi:hypothetical protein
LRKTKNEDEDGVRSRSSSQVKMQRVWSRAARAMGRKK